MGTADIASRLRAKFSRRRHSAAGSLASSTQSTADTSSLGSRHLWDWHRGRDQSQNQSHNDKDHDRSSSHRAASQTRATPGGSSLDSNQPDLNLNKESKPPPFDGSRGKRCHEGLEGHESVDDSTDTDTNNEAAPIRVQLLEPETITARSTPVSSAAAPTATQAVPPTTDVRPEADTATDDPNSPLKPPGPRQTRGGLAPNSSHGPANDQHSSWQVSPQAQPHLQPNSSPLPTHSPELSPNCTPTRPRTRPSNSNLGRIYEDNSADSSPSPILHSGADADADADVDAEAEARDHDDPLSPGFAPSTSSTALSATATRTVVVPSTPSFAPTLTLPSSSPSPRPPAPPRRQSLLSNRQSTLINTLLHTSPPTDSGAEQTLLLPIDANMVTRKIWVKRPNASPTLVTINEDDLVDDVRDMILRKYANSLGRTFDSPDLNIRIFPRDQHKDRLLGPEEPMGRTLDAYFPGGQSVDEALIIDIPRRAPKASPRPVMHATNVYGPDDPRPSEAGEGYFPPVDVRASPHLPVAVPVHGNSQAPHSIAVLGTGQIPPIPSPGGSRTSRTYRERPERPRLGRTHTSSPTILANGPAANASNHGTQHFNPRLPHARTHSNSSEAGMPPPPPPTLPTPPAPEPSQVPKPKKSDHPNLPPGMLNGGVPPINVLIVEDNPINLKLLEAFVKRLKVRWQSAMNGRDAVKKWRTGGFHLVLMDIQLPVMNGLDATREIRRLERVNSIGVFSSMPSSGIPEEENPDELKDQDRLENPSLFMSPVIIVALTASSLQSDRHEALAAGCNDFLTKPVNFVWLERKVMEWGCMQALIDFDGWRRWKVISQEAEEKEAAKKAAATAAKTKPKKNKALSIKA
ncbi:hypothetical protein B0J13DRAFT_651126 [Dactylonectria estremocensis]|uniref:Response regulatory domain-containing protein n=1 Tax=Dactylonectria estremocensis TaxID=1079267 RepID=A0A9P9FCL2_9HYPO|nr:hypothetical protein B0J13DRAFT_651126 [Dactylonectria estremocensis]